MFRGRLLFAGYAAFLVLFPSLVNCNAKKNHHCDNSSSCGSILNISYPFRLQDDPESCGDPNYELVCENNETVLYLYSGKYYVRAINHNNSTIRVVVAGVQKNNCSSIPLYYLNYSNFSAGDPYHLRYTESIIFINCENPVRYPLYVETAPCINGVNSSNSSISSSKRHSYVLLGDPKASDVADLCRIDLMVVTTSSPEKNINITYSDIHNELAYGFELSWFSIYCEECKGQGYCELDNNTNVISCVSLYSWNVPKIIRVLIYVAYAMFYGMMLYLGLNLAAKILCGMPLVFVFLIYKWRRRHLSMFDRVEDFLRSHNNLMPIRYSFSDIKKMTKGFKDKLGEGGYGSVYKGKLRSGRIVAVKILGKSKANGQEFINEVATIGRIHHVNVVQLIGFCAERSKRALVYEFMPNGSLEKYIFPLEEGNISLSCERMYEISLGVARGIEYLHRGCEIQILHFDIKPHNILLDENFTPKVSDFGLAKLYPTDDSIVSLTAARGTMGYIAPELFYKNIGGVSYKADVYSFGMLLMEIVGRRKNLNAFAEHSSQIYLPSWVYDQFSKGKDIEMGGATEEECKLAKKMVIVALWCIQLKPSDRPSMKKVTEVDGIILMALFFLGCLNYSDIASILREKKLQDSNQLSVNSLSNPKQSSSAL